MIAVLIALIVASGGVVYWCGGLAKDVKRNTDDIKYLRKMNEERAAQEIKELKMRVDKLENNDSKQAQSQLVSGSNEVNTRQSKTILMPSHQEPGVKDSSPVLEDSCSPNVPPF